jgi:hypothetical protein
MGTFCLRTRSTKQGGDGRQRALAYKRHHGKSTGAGLHAPKNVPVAAAPTRAVRFVALAGVDGRMGRRLAVAGPRSWNGILCFPSSTPQTNPPLWGGINQISGRGLDWRERYWTGMNQI